MALKDFIPLFGAGLQAGATIYSGAQQRRAVRDRNQQSIELAKFQHQKDLEMWEEMKKYNAPTAQMQRFKEAGLNPHLIYGQGTPGNVQSHPEFQAPNLEVEPALGLGDAIGEGISTYQDVRQKEAQIDQTESLANKAEQDAIRAEWLADSELYRSLMAQRENKREALFQGEIMKHPQKYANARWNEFLETASKQEKQNVGQELRNKYQREINRLAEIGLRPGDTLYLGIGLGILDKLGINTDSLEQQLQKLTGN